MAVGERITLGLRAGGLGEEDLFVSRVEGAERLSEPFAFVADVSPAVAVSLDLDAFVGEEAVLAIRRSTGEERWVHGECVRAELRAVAAGVPHYRVTVGPRLLRLGCARRSRIFQDLSPVEVVQQVLDEHGVEHRAALAGRYDPRAFIVQYRESDLAFVSRLLEAEGIWYRFEHAEDGHALVLCDAAGSLADPGLSLPVRDPAGEVDGVEHLFHFGASHQLVPESAARRDFDFEHPDVELAAASGQGELEVYEHAGVPRDSGGGAREAKARLEELRHGARTFEGRGTSVRVLPGIKLEVEGAGKISVVSASHRAEQHHAPGTGEVVGTYESSFAGIDAAAPYRPRRLTPWPRISGIQTATVVVAGGDEIHTEEFGRVKVQFHWDRDGRRDEHSSCWVRLAQPWAGAAMGASFIPRVGQEVVIRFLEGDPDRPLAIGAVYNGANLPPLQLPLERTRSTQRTDSTPGGEGANELAFEDDAGREEIYLHAQRDQALRVRNDRSEQVRRNAALTVGGNRSEQVLGARELKVEHEDVIAVGGEQALTVAGARFTHVKGAHLERVELAQALNVAGTLEVAVGAASAMAIGKDATIAVADAATLGIGATSDATVGGEKSTQISGNVVASVGNDHRESVRSDRALDVDDDEQHVHGSSWSIVDGDADESDGAAAEVSVGPEATWTAKTQDLQADQLAVEVAGKPVLSIDSQGNVKLWAANMTIDGSTLELKGSAVKKTAAESTQEQKTWVELELVDENGDPVPDEKFELHLANGDVRSGQLDGSGKAKVEDLPPGACSVVFPDCAKD